VDRVERVAEKAASESRDRPDENGCRRLILGAGSCQER
jgi:hypothetical protein